MSDNDNGNDYDGMDTDIFSGMGDSLLKDLLSDINAATDASSGFGGVGDLGDDTLASLERELARFTDGDSSGGGGLSAAPPGMGAITPGISSTSAAPPPPGLGVAPPSAAALVVGHAAERSAARMPPPPPGVSVSSVSVEEANGNGGLDVGDAWAASIAKFSTMGMTDDFLAADSARKREKIASAPSSGSLPPGIGFDDYDVEEKVKLTGGEGGSVPPPRLGAPPGLASVTASSVARADASRAEAAAPAGSGGGGGPHPPGMSPHRHPHGAMPHPFPGPRGAMPPDMRRPGMPHARHGVPPGGAPMLPPGVGMVLSPGALLPGVIPPGMPHGVPTGGMPPEMMGMPPGALPPGTMPPGMMMPLPGAVHSGAPVIAPPGPKDLHVAERDGQEVTESAFKKKDFPVLGKETKEGQDEDEAGDEPLIPLPKRPEPLPEPEYLRSSVAELQAVQTQLLFNNPTPNAPPISATQVRSELMNARDICYVVHSYMRPLHSLDAYNDDYYRWGYDDRKSRNILVLGGVVGSSSSGVDLPKPVWKEEKIKAKEIEENYRSIVETRAKDWGEKRHVLGRNIKVNVRRPKALLATDGALTSKLREEDARDDDAISDSSEHGDSPEEKARARIWSARLSIDRGYVAYLALVELRRLLQSNDPAEMQGRKREELSSDVESSIEKLHTALGVCVTLSAEEGGRREISVHDAILSRTLSLPKGRMLLSRALDEAILPHSSACRVLPAAVGAVLRSPPSESASGGAPPRGEDRMLRSLAGLVRTVQPSVAARDLLDCLDSVRIVHADLSDGKSDEGGATIKSMLGGQRARMELLHAILTRGNELCLDQGSDCVEEWKDKEGKFMALLSAAQRR